MFQYDLYYRNEYKLILKYIKYILNSFFLDAI